ncbi:unnamed protein product [Blepharisma stoltei]|uniref:Phosphofructokinase domain-containing protein n=1 Tax=Blepharisma stoltei TaxID=1481888 RepID=A0AAU9IMU5_9CILI|nr:unnamed protein product [Blepharisma stoltei]
MDIEKWLLIFSLGSTILAILSLFYYKKRFDQCKNYSLQRHSGSFQQLVRVAGNVCQEHRNLLNVKDRSVQVPIMISHRTDEEILLNPMLGTGKKNDVGSGRSFMPETLFYKLGGYVIADSAFPKHYVDEGSILFLKGSPRKEILINPNDVKAAIVTCGGLCPGLNVVIRELVMTLWYNYGVKHISGIIGGYPGFYTQGCLKTLTPSIVADIHLSGGTILKTSRGGWNLEKIMDSIIKNGFNQVYIIGGDGTHRGIKNLVDEIERKHLPIYVVGIPKTIDNDIPIIDKSFGFDTAVEEAQKAIESANTEANSVEYGIGLVKLMGRNSGFIAMQASNANRNVNLCLIPESGYELTGPNGVYSYISERLKVKKHAVIVVAEGAAASCLDEKLAAEGTDPSGNPILYDIGKHLKEELVKCCKKHNINATLKYIDPTYMIRTVPANSSDKILCSELAQAAVHGTFAGFTGFSVGNVTGQAVFIPIDLLISIKEGKDAKEGQRRVDIDENMMWWRLMANTGQPSFIND